MNLRTLVARSLRFHWRSHLGVVLGAAVATTVLVGALVVGDSVRWSLRRMALARLGKTELALVAPERFVRPALAEELSGECAAPAAAVLQVRGMAARLDGAARVTDVQVLGVDEHFWAMGDARPPLAAGSKAAAVINERTARALRVKAGDRIFVRLQKPTAVSLDVPFSGETEGAEGYHLPVTAVASDSGAGRFSLAANQVPPYNVFVPMGWLQEQLDLAGKANVLLLGAPTPGKGARSVSEALAKAFQLADAEHEVRPVPGQDAAEIRTTRVFLDPPVVRAAAEAKPDAVGVLTYLVNELRVGDKTTPYSMVTAIGPLGPAKSAAAEAYAARILPADMADDQIVINSWLADDLAAKVGDDLTLVYFVPGPMRRLTETSRTFRIRAVVPTEAAPGDRTLMPDFPGLSDVDNCRDWEPGFSLDREIRPKDQAYWETYRGTPKAFVTLAAGRKMWKNRFGDLTAVRFPGASRADVERAILGHLDPADLGLYFQPVRERALAASGQALDFGQLFLGLSFFLIVAALVLTGLLFALGAEQRARETGTLLAVGFPPKRVRRLMLAEGAALVLVGAAAGTVGGVVYTWV
ncbi:MAG TPA: ABC transporter permease, partial [Phycisphaerae bacterium]|nr:ABC transporter permease [Phycisphaerae bacterium]